MSVPDLALSIRKTGIEVRPQRADALWALFDSYPPDAFVVEMTRLVSERPADDAAAAHELGGAYDSTGRSELAVPHYRRALELGLEGSRHRQAVIQLASSLRNLGRASESVSLLEQERDARSDELDDAVRAFLAFALVDVGREREAAGIALGALAPHLPRYQRSVKNYAQALLPE
ncbi:MAG: tetratricopeptide repeat protein [Homoserinimonas sp.]